MGYSNWSDDFYKARVASKRDAGIPLFAYDASTKSKPRNTWKVHDLLNPHGVKVRESRDSDAHPNSKAIAVLFDVTGSMSGVPKVLQAKLPGLMGLLLRKGYIDDPQILFGAIGDATCDRVPLQIGQFESGVEMDEHLTNFLLEGGGGGQTTESYELGMYFLARHTAADCWEKRGQKGYAFFIGDEQPYRQVKKSEVSSLIGATIESDIPVEAIMRELQERYEVFYIMPAGTHHAGEQQILDPWRALLGQNIIQLDNAENVCEAIASAIGICEGRVGIDEAVSNLTELGVDAGNARAVGTALAPLGDRAVVAKGEAGTALMEPTGDEPGGVERL